MNVKEFKNITKDLSLKTIIKISNFTYEYTKNHTDVAESCFIDYNKNEGLELIAYKENNMITTIEDFNKVIINYNIPLYEDLTSWDSDDGNIIEYTKYIIADDSIILCVE